MDSAIKNFLNIIGVQNLTPFEKASFTSFQNNPINNQISVTMLLDDYLDYATYQNLFDRLSDYLSKNGFGIQFSFQYLKESKKRFETILNKFKAEHKCQTLDDCVIYDEEKKILFYYQEAKEAQDISNETRKLKDFLDSITSSYHILTQQRVYFDDDFTYERDDEYQSTADEVSAKLKQYKDLQTHYQPCKLKDVEQFNMVIVEGKIFKLGERKKTKKNLIIQPIEYTDGSDSIGSNLFEGKKFTKEFIDQFSVGKRIRVYGRPEHNKFSNELEIRIDTIEEIQEDEASKRVDTSEKKRIELHAHTKMSAFDGLASITDYVKQAKEWGMSAIALTDHGNVQAYPEAQKIQAKTGLKVIYGTEFYVVDDKLNFIYNPSDKELAKENFVIFDTETTGLSCRYDRLIEFGAVKMSPTGEIIDEIDFFINPDGHKLSKFSIETSHIRQEDVDRGKPIKQALNDIMEFFSDSIIVAHNASFDFDFINEALKNNKMPLIQNPVIDTLPLARYLFPDMRSHREEALARRLGIEFDATGAHRANYDAMHLAKIFDALLSQLNKKFPHIKHKDLQSLPVSTEMMLGLHPYHVTAYVKNLAGVKDLYNLVSDSYTKYLSKGTPLVPRSLLEKNRQNLILGSACLNGEVWEAATTKGEEKVKKLIQPYDFIEVQPPANYIYKIHKGELSSFDEIESIIKDLIRIAKENGKIVCATGDCHYLNPEDKIYRDVFISSKGLQGARHPLNLAPYDSASNEKKQAWYHNPLPNPDQHFRTTDEMLECFAFLKDKDLINEIVIENTNKIADMVDDDVVPLKTGTYPPYIEGCVEKLADLSYQTAKELYGDPLPKEIQERLETELAGITKGGYAVVYWLSSDIVRWSNSKGYLIGSRGSVGSSFVATMSGITEVNPLPAHWRCPHCKKVVWADVLKYDSGFDLPEMKCPDCGTDMLGDGQNIPFATFLGFKGDKVPDIDLNFPSDFQSTAHLHMQEVLNASGNHCYKAGTIQTTQEKQARGYVLGYYESLGIDHSKIRNAEIDRLAAGCVDVKRSTGQHPGGVIVIPKGMDASDFTPVQYPADDPNSKWETTHYDFHAIHDNVLKFDMLGHVDPVAIKMQCDLCGFSFMDMKTKIPISDAKAKSLFWSADALNLKQNVLKQETGALGLPEFGTENGRRVLVETKPRSFSDLVRISGLSHGTGVFAGNAEELITKENHTLGDVIACRDDIMTVLHDKYGVDNSSAFKIMEFTRKGMFGKPGNEDKKEEYDKILHEHNVPEWYINSCHKIEYMFPKGHAVAYVSNAIRCAWFKVYEPLAYYATYFTLRCDAYDIKTMMKGILPCLKKRDDILRREAAHEDVKNTEIATINAYESTIEMYDRGMSFAPLDVNVSLATKFSIDRKSNKVIPSLTCVPSLGESLALQIVKAREEHPFTSIEDLKQRGHVGDKMIDTLRDLKALGDLPEDEQMTLF